MSDAGLSVDAVLVAAERSDGVPAEAVQTGTVLSRIAVVVSVCRVVVAVLIRTGRVVRRTGRIIVALIAVVAGRIVRRTGRHLVVGVFNGGFRELQALEQVVIDTCIHVGRKKQGNDVENY